MKFSFTIRILSPGSYIIPWKHPKKDQKSVVSPSPAYVTNVCPLNPPTSQNFSPITRVILLATDENEGFTRLEICTIDAKLQSIVNNSLQRQKFVATLTSRACEKGFCLTIQNATCKRICTKSCKYHLENRLQHQNLCISIYMRMSLIFAHCKLLDQVLFETAVILIL